MPDMFTKEERSRIMSRIKSKNTKPEIQLRKEIWKRGIRYRINYPIFGKPDLAFPNRKLAVFVDGCFWHKCPIHQRLPNTNKSYWQAKIEKNWTRDRVQEKKLKKKGWKILRFWEHDIKSNTNKCTEKIIKEL